jgi:hypothetical protein
VPSEQVRSREVAADADVLDVSWSARLRCPVTDAAVCSTVHNGRMMTRNPEWDALRDAIALVRARTDTETDLMLP